MSTLMAHAYGNSYPRSTFFTVSKTGGTLTVQLAGPRLGEAQATVIAPEIKELMDEMGGSIRGLILDLSEVRVMSSFGLGLCIELRNYARQRRSETTLVGMCPDIRELFRIMRVDRLFSIALNQDHLNETLKH